METEQQKEPEIRRRNRSPSKEFCAAQRAEAVLKIWAERQTPAQICREMSITWTILNQWEKRAMEGMLQALEPRVRLDKGPALSPRLQSLLAKRQPSFPAERLRRKLKDLPGNTSMGD